MQAKSSLHLLSLSLSRTHTRTNTHIEGWLGSVTGCKQSPFSSYFVSLSPPLPPSVLHRHPRWSGPVTGAPEGQKPVGQWQVTVDSLSQRHRPIQIHTTLVCLPLSLRCHCSLFFLCYHFFFSLFLLSPSFFLLKLLTQAVPPELVVPGSPQLLCKPRAGSLHWGAKWFWPPLKPWRFGRRQGCSVGRLMHWSPAGRLVYMWIY